MKNISNKDTFEKREEKKLFIETYGCQMNVADSEVVASINASKRSFRDCPIFNRCVNIRNLW